MSQNVMEVVRFNLVPGVTPEAVVDAARDAGAWIATQPGFVGRRVGRSEDGTWIDWIEWTDMVSAKAAADKIMDAPVIAPFLAMIDMASIDMRHYTVGVAL